MLNQLDQLNKINMLENQNRELSKDIKELETIVKEQNEKTESLQVLIQTIFNLLECHHENRLITLEWPKTETALCGILIICKDNNEAKRFYARSFPAKYKKRYSRVIDIKHYYLNRSTADLD